MTTADPAVAALIREVLAEELARLRADVREERVRIADDTDLAAFARRVLAVADDRGAREALESGRLVFRLDAGAGAPRAPPAGMAPGVVESPGTVANPTPSCRRLPPRHPRMAPAATRRRSRAACCRNAMSIVCPGGRRGSGSAGVSS